MADKASFAVRIDEKDEIDIATFDRVARERGTGREELVRQLMRGFLKRLADKEETEQYYTIKGYSDDHKSFAYIHNMDGHVTWNQDGLEYRSHQWQLLEHAIDLVERSEPGDKDEAVRLFKEIFDERNVFVKDE